MVKAAPKHYLMKRKLYYPRFYAEITVRRTFFSYFREINKEKFRYSKNRIYICCEMKP